MGHIKRLLAIKELESRGVTPQGLWADLCENVHLHVRNVRFDMSQEEWARVRAAVNHIGKAVEYLADKESYEEGDPNFLMQVQYNFPYKSPSSDYYPNRSLLELQEDGTVHFHYRDLRLHWTPKEFEEILDLFQMAKWEMNKVEDGVYSMPDWVKKAKKVTRGWLPIRLIQPYDDGHRAGAIDEEHREGINYCKSLIAQGRIIRPIYIAPTGQRLDGFKRYMAHVEMDKGEIEVIVDPFWIKDGMALSGQQHNQPMLDDEELGKSERLGKSAVS